MAEENENLLDELIRNLRTETDAATRYSLVMRAVRMNNMWAVATLLDMGFPINASETDHDSPLHLAVKSNLDEMVELLLEEGADFNRKNENGETPFLHAVEKGKLRIVEHFLEHGADVNVDLFNAIRRGNLQETTRLIGSPEESASSGLFGGYSPLRLAVHKNQVDIAKLLLERGYPVNASETVPYSHLHFAVANGNREMVELLLRNGADVNAESYKGMTCLHFYSYYEYAYTYPNPVAESEPVILEMAKHLLNKGANVNAQAHDGCTPLHTSIQTKFYSLADFLLRCSADINLANAYGETALHFAAKVGGREIAASLTAKGADVNSKSSNGITALHMAVENGYEKVAELLLANGAIVNCVDNYGDSPFHRLAESEEYQFKETMCTVLLKWGADVNCKNKIGRTALHIAAEKGHAELVEFLLENGADINIKCNSNLKPLDISTADTRDLLLRHQVKMEGVGLHVEESRFSASDELKLDELRKSYQEEVLLLRSEFINNTSVSYYDFVRKDVRFLAKYMDNENVVQAAELEEYRSKFPTYASMIKRQFRRGRARTQLIKLANQVFNQLIYLPDYCTDKILDYLSDDDLAVLISVSDLVTD